MDMNEKIAYLLNDQINKELYSAYLYLDISNYFKRVGLDGFANWYYIQAQEERDHAMLFFKYLQNGVYEPMASVQTIANAMDVGDPSNFARIYDLYNGSHAEISKDISGATYSDAEIAETMKACYQQTGYVLDPHGACGFQALTDTLQDGEIGVFCETAHPAKFKDTVDSILNTDINIPERLQAFMKGEKRSIPMSKNFADFKAFLMNE